MDTQEMSLDDVKRVWLAIALCALGTLGLLLFTLEHFAEERCLMRASDEITEMYGLDEMTREEAYAVPGAWEDMDERRAVCAAL